MLKKQLLKIITVKKLFFLSLKLLLYKIKVGKNLSKSAYKKIEEWDIFYQNGKNDCLKRGYLVATKDYLKKHKKSNTLYILGSGPSINDVKIEEWNHIRKHDSIGFNFFFTHSFVPTFYHMELLEENSAFFKECYQLIKHKYQLVPFMINYIHLPKNYDAQDLSYINNLAITIPKRYNRASKKEFKEICHYHYFNKKYADENLLIHYRASIMIMISFGVLMGYKNIVLVGVDLMGNEHFYFDSKYDDRLTKKVKKWNINRLEKTKSDSLNKIHATADPNLYPGNLTIDQIIKIYNKEVLKNLNINLYLYNKKSILYPDIPVCKGKL